MTETTKTAMTELARLGQEFDGGWQPIATAPRDGTDILAYGNVEFEIWEVVGFEVNDSGDMIGGFPASEWVWIAAEGTCRHRSVFTHWKPLDRPTPPTTLPETEHG